MTCPSVIWIFFFCGKTNETVLISLVFNPTLTLQYPFFKTLPKLRESGSFDTHTINLEWIPRMSTVQIQQHQITYWCLPSHQGLLIQRFFKLFFFPFSLTTHRMISIWQSIQSACSLLAREGNSEPSSGTSPSLNVLHIAVLTFPLFSRVGTIALCPLRGR